MAEAGRILFEVIAWEQVSIAGADCHVGKRSVHDDNIKLVEAEGDALDQEVTRGTFPVINQHGRVPLPTGPGLGSDLAGAEMARRFPVA